MLPIGRLRATVGALRGGAPTLAAVAVAWFLAFGTRLVLPAVLPAVRADLGIDNATAGLVLTALWVAYALTQFPSGLLADRVGERWVLVASTAVGGLAALGIGLSAGPAGFVAGVVLFGLGTGLYATPRVMVVSRVYPRRATTALGVVFAAGNVGTSTLPALAGVAAGAVGWRAGFLAVAPAFLLAAAGLRTALPAGPADATGTDAAGLGAALRTAAAELRRRPVRYAAVVLVGFGFAYQGLVAFLPTYLVDRTPLGPAAASALFGLLFASGLVAQLLAGGLADRIGRRPVLLACLALTLAGLAGLVTVRGRLALAVVVAVLGLQIGFWPVITAYAYDALSDGDRGGGFGLVRTVYLCLGATGPLAVGTLFDAGRYEGGIGLLAAAFALVGLVCLRLPAVRTTPTQS